MKRFFIILILLLLPQSVGATVYFVDFTNGLDSNNGTATTTPFGGLDAFTEVARSAGDIAYVRRGTATTTVATNLTFLSDGTLNNPITLSADYDNLWSDFATSTQTYTPVPGTKTMEASDTITGISANQWIYVEGDCAEAYNTTTAPTCEWAYEVATVSGTTLTLYLPYLGPQTASGLSLRVMPANPQWGVVTTTAGWAASRSDFWRIQGFDVRSTIAQGALNTNSPAAMTFTDMILQHDGVSATATGGMRRDHLLKKTRMFGGNGNPANSAPAMKSVLIDCNSVASAVAIGSIGTDEWVDTSDIEVKNCSSLYTGTTLGAGASGNLFIARNVTITGAITGSAGLGTMTGTFPMDVYFEDLYGTVGLNMGTSNKISSNTLATTTMSTVTNLRSGGGTSNMFIMPPAGTTNTGISTTNFPTSFIKLFEYPIYTDATSRTYSMFFNSTSTGQWTTDPTASEFWIECEYYVVNSTSNANMVIKKSTSVADFNGSTDWQSLSVTCAPAQAGVLYLRGYYGKPKEAGANWFYMDMAPVIS